MFARHGVISQSYVDMMHISQLSGSCLPNTPVHHGLRVLDATEIATNTF